MRRINLVIIFNLIILSSYSQHLTQTIRGAVVDKITQVPLAGVNVILLGSDPLKGTTTDIEGQFRILDVPVGKQSLKILFLGYEEQVLSNLVVNSGKELVLQINMEEKVIQGKEITVTANREKNVPMNEMAIVSTRTFSVEETKKYAAAINDPARMASSFAGVVSADDGNNNISIRGNAPNTLQWRMEGVEIPNPNHFSAPGTSGGGISILSSQLLYNSDFLTGAFPAEYGNALSGVFDLRLRKGNNEKQEFTIQAGFLGLDAAVEGPLSKKYQGSYLINYRYSTLAAIGKMIKLGDALTLFQDLSFNVYLPTKKFGSFGIFGFGGLSSQRFDAKKDSLNWEDEGSRYGDIFKSATGAVGLTNSYLIGQNTYIKSALVASKKEVSDLTTRLNDELNKEVRFDGIAKENKITLTSTLNHKFNSQLSIRTGFVVNKLGYNINYNEFDSEIKKLVQTINTTSSSYSSQLFGATTFKITNQLTVQGGIHYTNFFYNQTSSVEERASIRYAFGKKQNVSFGYGRHSQLQPIGVYFANYTNEAGIKIYPNKNLGLSKSLHYVLSYDRMLTQKTHLKLEFYYQDLYNIPISTDSTKTYSMVNENGSFVTDPLVNKGIGRNIGTELTLEQYLFNDFYYLLSGSLYNSEYKAMDNRWRNTKFNGNYAITLTTGKEFKTGEQFKKRIIGVNLKVIYTGGFRATPINFDESLSKGETVYYEDKAFSEQMPSYFRTDLRISLKRNRPNSTHTISLDIQNATNRKTFLVTSSMHKPEK